MEAEKKTAAERSGGPGRYKDMAYKKHGTAADARKGNRKPGPRETSAIESYNKQYKMDIDKYKRFAEARRAACKYRQEYALTMYTAFEEYIKEQTDKREPMTIAGALLKAGLDRRAWDAMRRQDYDYRLEEYIDTHNIDESTLDPVFPVAIVDNEPVLFLPFSAICQKMELVIQDQRERACSSLKGNPAGNIFLLKAQQGFRDDPETPQQLNQTLVIADKDQATKALEMLTGPYNI